MRLVLVVAAFVVWSQAELKAFTNALSIQVFTSTASLSNIAECISIARNHCDQVITFFFSRSVMALKNDWVLKINVFTVFSIFLSKDNFPEPLS